MNTYRTLLLIPLLLTLSPSHAEVLSWAVVPLPGAAMQGVEGDGTGFVFDAQRLLEGQLPELAHRHRASSAKRLDRNLRSGNPLCSMTVLRRASRDEVAYFISYLPVVPMELVSRAGSLPDAVLKNGQVSLRELLAAPLRGGISPGRAYPPELQGLIREGVASGRIEVLSTPSLDVNLVAMISHRRLDYSFEFPVVSEHLSRNLPLPEPVVSLPIVESQRLITTGLYCPRTAWGRAMAARIDGAVRRLVQAPDALLALYSASQRARYEDLLRDHLRNRAMAQFQGIEPPLQ